MDLASFGFDITTIAAIIGICLALKLYVININKDKPNKISSWVEKNILLFVVLFGIIAGIVMSLGSLTKDIIKDIPIVFKNSIIYAGGSVLFHQLYKQFFEKKDEDAKNN
jgi:hypothetical protein